MNGGIWFSIKFALESAGKKKINSFFIPAKQDDLSVQNRASINANERLKMESNINQFFPSPEKFTKNTKQYFPPLNIETRINVDTETAAYHLNRKPQTLRNWACFENGAIRPIRVNSRLAWPVSELRRVLGAQS